MNWTQKIYTEQGTEETLDSLLPNEWCLLILFRHAECMECNLLVHELNGLQHHLAQWNISIVGVGNSDIKAVQRLRERLQISPKIQLCAHPQKEIHNELQLYNSFWRAWGYKAIWNTLKGFHQGHIQTSLGFPMGQQSGIALLSPKKEICWMHKSRFLGDIPTQGKILEQVLLHRGL